MSEEKKIEIIPVVDKHYGTVTLCNFDKVIDEVEKTIKANSTFTNPTDEQELKLCKEERANLNAKAKGISSARIAVVKYLTGEFQEQCKALEKALKEASDKHTEAINKSKPQADSGGIPSQFMVMLDGMEQSKAKKIIDYIEENGGKIVYGGNGQ